jgi:catechol 2,3-dioxygenase-like lactoylglutathione lyase family enzyme
MGNAFSLWEERMEHLPPEALVRKVDCVRLYVSDLDAGLTFYRDRLGHELVWRTPDELGLGMSDSDAEIVLHKERRPPEIDLKVRSAGAAAARFAAAGGEIAVGPFDIQIGRCVVVRDPWGNELVLLDASKGRLSTDADGNVVRNMPCDTPKNGPSSR